MSRRSAVARDVTTAPRSEFLPTCSSEQYQQSVRARVEKTLRGIRKLSVTQKQGKQGKRDKKNKANGKKHKRSKDGWLRFVNPNHLK